MLGNVINLNFHLLKILNFVSINKKSPHSGGLLNLEIIKLSFERYNLAQPFA